MKQPLQAIETATSNEQAAEEPTGTQQLLSPPALPSVSIGRLLRLDAYSPPLVDFPSNDSGELVPARSTVALCASQVGDEVALAFEEGDPSRPIILGVLQPWATIPAEPLRSAAATASLVNEPNPDRLLLTAANEITLRCGKASITLTNAGKLLLRGAYLLSRSSGVNRIKGGSVQIN
jgi:hypothetical protein